MSSYKKLHDLEKQGIYVFHGSENLVDEFEPRQAHTVVEGKKIPDGEPAIFASPFSDYAIFMAIINKKNCSKGYFSGCSFRNGVLTFRATKHTLDQLSDTSSGYVYIFNKTDFQERNGSEWVSYEKVKPIEKIEVNRTDLKMSIEITEEQIIS